MKVIKNKKGISKVFAYLFSMTMASALLVGNVQAAPIFTDTGNLSGGNPGGQSLWEVSNLVQGDAFDLSWGGVTGLSGSGMVFIDGLSSTSAQIRVMIENDSTPISNGDPRFTSFGLSVDNISGFSTTTGGNILDLADDSNFPGFAISVCATAGNNCAGGGNAGIDEGMSDEFTLDVLGNFGLTPALTLGGFALKVQGGPNGDSFELAGIPTAKEDPQNDPIPEPGMVLLFGFGLAAFGFARRQHKA